MSISTPNTFYAQQRVHVLQISRGSIDEITEYFAAMCQDVAVTRKPTEISECYKIEFFDYDGVVHRSMHVYLMDYLVTSIDLDGDPHTISMSDEAFTFWYKRDPDISFLQCWS